MIQNNKSHIIYRWRALIHDPVSIIFGRFSYFSCTGICDSQRDDQQCQHVHKWTKYTLSGVAIGVCDNKMLIPIYFQSFSLIYIIFIAMFSFAKHVDVRTV